MAQAQALTERVVNIAATLDTAAKLESDATYRRQAGYTRMAEAAENGAQALLATLHESPSIARLRAAVLLLDGITDETIAEGTRGARAHLMLMLDKIDDGEL